MLRLPCDCLTLYSEFLVIAILGARTMHCKCVIMPGLAAAGACAAGEERKLQVRGLFYGIGHMPNSGIVAGQVDLDEKGYVKVYPAASSNAFPVACKWPPCQSTSGSSCEKAVLFSCCSYCRKTGIAALVINMSIFCTTPATDFP